jgi:hypothetical protein
VFKLSFCIYWRHIKLLHINNILKIAGLQVSRLSNVQPFRRKLISEFLRDARCDHSQDWSVQNFLQFVTQLGVHTTLSTSQLLQDYFALYCNKSITKGFYVEFGACNGVEGSNTLLLEQHYLWDGLLAEPGQQWKSELVKNRSCSLDFRCVHKRSGEVLDFVECGQLSTIKAFALQNDDWAMDLRRASQTQYKVQTVSLLDLLASHNAPTVINYMSVDTEGSEYDCLVNFDFHKYKINCLTVEHNYQQSRQLVYDLLVSNGFIRVLTEVSMFDDWYVHQTLINN